MKQTHTSAKTSVRQIPAVFRLINETMSRPEQFWAYARDVLDYGGGAYDDLTDRFAKMRIRNWVYDPYNRPRAHNELVRKLLLARPADVAICSNVLNVIKEPEIRQEVLRDIVALTGPDATVFVTVYEGDRTSRGKKTTKGWQANRPTASYKRELQKVFVLVTRVGRLFVCTGQK